MQHTGTIMQEYQPPFGACNPSPITSALLFFSKNTPLGRGRLRRRLGRSVLRRHAAPFDVQLWGTSVRLYPEANKCDFKVLMKPAEYCRKELEFLNQHLARPGAVFFDIGANSGFFSLHTAVNAKTYRQIFSFEPNPEMIRRLGEKISHGANAALFNNAQWHLCPYALGDNDGTANLVIPERNYGEASISDGDDGISINLRSINSVMAEHNLKRIDALKIDVEGYEDKIMRSLFETVDQARWPKAIVIESVHDNQWQWNPIAHAKQRGYREVFKTRNNTALIRCA